MELKIVDLNFLRLFFSIVISKISIYSTSVAINLHEFYQIFMCDSRKVQHFKRLQQQHTVRNIHLNALKWKIVQYKGILIYLVSIWPALVPFIFILRSIRHLLLIMIRERKFKINACPSVPEFQMMEE